MNRTSALFALAVALISAPAAQADTRILINGFPTEYTPGESFTFEVRAGGIPGPGNVFSYSIALDFGVLDPALLTISVAKPDDTSLFAFQDNPSILLSAAGLGDSQINFSFSAFQLPDPEGGPTPSVEIIVGQNDILGVVTVTPGLGLTGPIVLTVNPDQTSFETGGESSGVKVPEPLTANPGAGPTTPVPAPSSWLMMGVGALGMAAIARRKQPIATV